VIVRLTLLSLLLSLLGALGCGGSDRPATAPVSGVVLLDGNPVEGAAVMFMPVAGGRPAQGLTDAQGKFALTTFETNDGALLGDHKVSVTKMTITGATETAEGLSGTTDAGEIKETWLVPQKYSLPDTSELTAKVEKGMPALEFKLSSQ
jgi:hypothetical protein